MPGYVILSYGLRSRPAQCLWMFYLAFLRYYRGSCRSRNGAVYGVCSGREEEQVSPAAIAFSPRAECLFCEGMSETITLVRT
jgi:hypothetical protein